MHWQLCYRRRSHGSSQVQEIFEFVDFQQFCRGFPIAKSSSPFCRGLKIFDSSRGGNCQGLSAQSHLVKHFDFYEVYMMYSNCDEKKKNKQLTIGRGMKKLISTRNCLIVQSSYTMSMAKSLYVDVKIARSAKLLSLSRCESIFISNVFSQSIPLVTLFRICRSLLLVYYLIQNVSCPVAGSRPKNLT